MIQFRSGRWENLDELSPDTLLAEMRDQVTRALVAAGAFFAGEIKLTLTGPRHGRTYKVSKTGTLHVASAPGEPPAVLFGNLRNSVGFSPPMWEGDTVTSEVGPGLGKPPAGGVDPGTSYARRLEWGGVDSRGVRIAPRPYMEPTELRVRETIEQMLEEAIG